MNIGKTEQTKLLAFYHIPRMSAGISGLRQNSPNLSVRLGSSRSIPVRINHSRPTPLSRSHLPVSASLGILDSSWSLASIIPSDSLHLSPQPTLSRPRTETKLNESAFSVAGPRAWNRLPMTVRQLSSLTIFKRYLKAYLFNEFFPSWSCQAPFVFLLTISDYINFMNNIALYNFIK